MNEDSETARKPSTRTQDGYVNSPLLEGYENKGGLNPAVSQVTVRPPAPPPSNPSGRGAEKPSAKK
jgi:hypothetical protein